MTNNKQYPFQDHTLPLDERVKDLIARFTLDEKIESMVQYQPAIERLGVSAYKHGTEAAHGMAWLGEATSFPQDRKSTRLNSSHVKISYAVFCLKKKTKKLKLKMRRGR